MGGGGERAGGRPNDHPMDEFVATFAFWARKRHSIRRRRRRRRLLCWPEICTRLKLKLTIPSLSWSDAKEPSRLCNSPVATTEAAPAHLLRHPAAGEVNLRGLWRGPKFADRRRPGRSGCRRGWETNWSRAGDNCVALIYSSPASFSPPGRAEPTEVGTLRADKWSAQVKPSLVKMCHLARPCFEPATSNNLIRSWDSSGHGQVADSWLPRSRRVFALAAEGIQFADCVMHSRRAPTGSGRAPGRGIECRSSGPQEASR